MVILFPIPDLSFEKTLLARTRDPYLIGSLIGSPDRIARNFCERSRRFLRAVAPFSAIRHFDHPSILPVRAAASLEVVGKPAQLNRWSDVRWKETEECGGLAVGRLIPAASARSTQFEGFSPSSRRWHPVQRSISLSHPRNQLT